MAGKEGKQFEADLESSCNDQRIFYFRVRDVNPMALKKSFGIPKNKYDCLMYYKNYLFPMEMKSVNAKSIGLKENMIKAHQIKSLKEATKYDGVIAGFIFNFRKDENRAFFVHIDDFIKYKKCAEEGVCDITYKNKVNKSSIPIGICEEIGIEIKNSLKQKYYRYYINNLLDELINKYHKGTVS